MARKKAVLIIYKSTDDQKTWQPVKPADVPKWLKKPDVLGRMLNGYVARNDESGLLVPEGARPWYRAERYVENEHEAARLLAAQEKRMRKSLRRAAVH